MVDRVHRAASPCIASGEIGLKMLSNSTPPTRLADSYSTWSSWRCTPNISCS